MTFARPWLQIFLAGCVWTEVAMAQTGTGFGGFGSGTGTTGSGTTGSTGTTGTPGTGTNRGSGATRQGMSSANQAATEGTDGTGTPGSDTTKPGTGTGTRPTQPPSSTPRPGTGTQPPPDPFGFGPPVAPPGPTSPFGPTRTPGATTTFGLEPRNAAPATTTETTESTTTTGGRSGPEPEAPSITAPSFYGKPQQVLTPGQGRFARPRYRYTVSAAMGFDDNPNQTPDGRDDIDDQVVTQVIPAQPEIATIVSETRIVGTKPGVQPGSFLPVYRTFQRKVVLRPAVPEQVIETPIPGTQFGEPQPSIVSRLDGHMDVQWANARELFTMDLRLGAEYYWSREPDPLDFNGSLAATYLRKLGPRTQFTGNANLSYQSQPDYTQVNVVNTPGSSNNYFVGNLKLDLTHRWAARFSTVTSLSGNAVLYEDAATGNSSYDFGLGNEFRYTQSPHMTWVLEARYTQLQYLEGIEDVINTAFLLVGYDWTVSRRLRTTLRLGEAVRTFKSGGGAASTPYGEVGVVYQPTRRDQFSLTGRYGFEQTLRPEDESIVGRFSAGYTRTFTPRFLGSLSANYINTSTTSTSPAGDVESTQTIYDASLLFQYTFTRRFSMNARYSYTLSTSSFGFNDYDRSRFFLTGEYEF